MIKMLNIAIVLAEIVMYGFVILLILMGFTSVISTLKMCIRDSDDVDGSVDEDDYTEYARSVMDEYFPIVAEDSYVEQGYTCLLYTSFLYSYPYLRTSVK